MIEAMTIGRKRPASIVLAVLLAAASAATLTASGTSATADPRDKWCKGVHLRFFVGGAEGDAFGTIVYNGAKQAERDLGPTVDYVFSGWDMEKMTQQLREAVAAKPDGIAMMGHPGDAAIMPLAEEASKAGIKMMYQNVPVPQVVATASSRSALAFSSKPPTTIATSPVFIANRWIISFASARPCSAGCAPTYPPPNLATTCGTGTFWYIILMPAFEASSASGMIAASPA